MYFKRILPVLIIILFLFTGCNKESSDEDDTIIFNFGSMDGPKHVQNEKTFPYFAEKVDELTDGKIQFRMYVGGSLGGPSETLDNIITGLIDVGRGIHGYNAGVFRGQSVLNLPFMAEGTGEELSIVAQKLYDTFPEIQEEYSDVKLLWVHAADPYAIITKGKAVRSFEDVEGLKLRTPSEEGSRMIASWGATPVSLPAPELYDALSKGVIDGGVLPIAAIKDFNLADVVDYVTIGNFNTNLFYVAMNKDSWEKIPPQDQKLIEENLLGIPMAAKAGREFDLQKDRAVKEAKEAGVEFITLPEEELEKFKEASKVVTNHWLKTMEENGVDGKKIYREAVKLMEKEGN